MEPKVTAKDSSGPPGLSMMLSAQGEFLGCRVEVRQGTVNPHTGVSICQG